MGFFGLGKSSAHPLNWKPLENEEAIKEIVAQSNSKPQLIFKHSTRCIISSSALGMFEKAYEYGDEVDLHFLDLIRFRNVSNAIATELGVHHESPQLILLHNQKVVHHASHHSIDAKNIKQYVG